MGVELVIKPGPAFAREEFLATHPPYAIALDGYVSGVPFLEVTLRGPYRNFNHHEMVDRSCMCATCEQARRAVLLGLYELFCDERGRRATLYVNDCDQDVCLATWILMHPERASEPLVRVIAQVEDLLDMSAGGFPMPYERDLLGETRWVFEPYTHARPHVTGMDAAAMRDVIDDVHARIEQFLEGRAGQIPLLGTYTRLGGDRWHLVEVHGQHAREKMVAAGVQAAVELRARRGENWVYSVWRRSEYVVWFPVMEVLRALNVAEGFAPDDLAGWGGSDNVGGSPRGVGSRLAPAEVERVVREVVARHAVTAG